MVATVTGSMPSASRPANASPDSFSNTRDQRGLAISPPPPPSVASPVTSAPSRARPSGVGGPMVVDSSLPHPAAAAPTGRGRVEAAGSGGLDVEAGEPAYLDLFSERGARVLEHALDRDLAGAHPGLLQERHLLDIPVDPAF